MWQPVALTHKALAQCLFGFFIILRPGLDTGKERHLLRASAPQQIGQIGISMWRFIKPLPHDFPRILVLPKEPCRGDSSIFCRMEPVFARAQIAEGGPFSLTTALGIASGIV